MKLKQIKLVEDYILIGLKEPKATTKKGIYKPDQLVLEEQNNIQSAEKAGFEILAISDKVTNYKVGDYVYMTANDFDNGFQFAVEDFNFKIDNKIANNVMLINSNSIFAIINND